MNKIFTKQQKNWQDKIFMNLAVNLSKRNIGYTHENPCVGAVLVKNETIISTGVTGENGVPHAENIAILKAGEKASGATLYVTLEPCSHFGKTPPCTDLIISSKISRVVIAVLDPDKRVNGDGVKKLQDAGIAVDVGLMEDEAKKVNRGFFAAKNLNRPFITLKLAISSDGKIARKDNKDRWISNEKSRIYAHFLRFKNDAILVGSNTVQNDDPMLDCRISSLEKYSPKRIILSSNLNIDSDKKIIQSAKKIPTYIATSNPKEIFGEFGIKTIHFKENDLNDFVKKLPQLGINNLLIEGGSIVASQFLKAGLIDQIILTKSLKIIGNDGVDAIAGIDINKIEDFGFKIEKVRTFEDDSVVTLTYVGDLCGRP